MTTHVCNRDCRKVRFAWDSETKLVSQLHRYRSDAGRCARNLVSEDCTTKLVTQWKPPLFSVAASLGVHPSKVIALSRMVKVGESKTSKLLRLCYPVCAGWGYSLIVTFSDSSLGHDGNVYKLSGFRPDSQSDSVFWVDETGKRVSPVIAGKRNPRAIVGGKRTLTRWVKRI